MLQISREFEFKKATIKYVAPSMKCLPGQVCKTIVTKHTVLNFCLSEKEACEEIEKYDNKKTIEELMGVKKLEILQLDLFNEEVA
jgi:hypothetical protein